MRLPLAQQQARCEALDAAERSGIREGLPPVSDFARAIGDRYVTGELTGDEGIEAIIQHHRDQVRQSA